MEIWRATLNEAMAMQSEHLSSYEVIYEDDTPLFEQLQAGEFSVDEDLACEMYEELISRATAAGFQQYEIANFARDAEIHQCIELHQSIPSLACKHNVNYWRGGSFYGLGPSATGYVRGVRTKNWSNTQLYCEQLEKGKRAIESSEELPPLRRAGEIAAFGLRMNAGWPFEEFQRTTSFDLRERMGGGNGSIGRTRLGWRDRRKNFSSRIRDCALPIRRRNFFCAEIGRASRRPNHNSGSRDCPTGYEIGNLTVKVVPAFSSLATSIVPAVRLDNRLGNRQPKPGIARAGARFVGAIKPFENARQIFGGNSLPGVGHGQYRPGRFAIPISRALRRRTGCIGSRWSEDW